MTFAGVAGPACGVHPFGAVAGGVDVDGDQDDVGHDDSYVRQISFARLTLSDRGISSSSGTKSLES